MIGRKGESTKGGDPREMPCCKAFEPDGQSGHLKVSLGFSVQAEHAHQNLRRFPFNGCWDKDHLPITHTAGALSYVETK